MAHHVNNDASANVLFSTKERFLRGDRCWVRRHGRMYKLSEPSVCLCMCAVHCTVAPRLSDSMDTHIDIYTIHNEVNACLVLGVPDLGMAGYALIWFKPVTH